MFDYNPFKLHFSLFLLFSFTPCHSFLNFQTRNIETKNVNVLFSTTKKTDEIFQPFFKKILFNGTNPNIAFKESLESAKKSFEQSVERDPFARSLVYLSQFSSESYSIELQSYFFKKFSKQNNLTLVDWQQQWSPDWASVFNPPGWEELSGNVSVLPILDPWFELQAKTSSLNLTTLAGSGITGGNSSVLPFLFTLDLGHAPRLPVQASLSSAIEDQLKQISDTEDIRNIVFFNSPKESLQYIPDNFTVQIGKDQNAETMFFYTIQERQSLFGSRPLNRATVKIARKNKLLQVACTTALVAKRSSLFKAEQSTTNSSLFASSQTWKQDLGVDLLHLTSTSVESFVEEVKDYIPTEARAKVREEYEYTRRKVLEEYEKVKTGLRNEVSRLLPSELLSGYEIDTFFTSKMPPTFEGAKTTPLIQPMAHPGPDPYWNQSLSILMNQPKIGPAISKEQYWTEGRNYPLLLHSCILFAQAPYNLERNRINTSVLEELITDLNEITAGGFIPEKWSKLLRKDWLSDSFPNTQVELKSLLAKTSNATSVLKEIGSLASSLAVRLLRAQTFAQLKAAFKDPVFKQLLSSKEYRRLGYVFSNELGTLVADLNTTTSTLLAPPESLQGPSSNPFPKTQKEIRALTENATSTLKEIGNLATKLASGSNFSTLLSFDRVQKAPAAAQLKDAFENPVFKKLLSSAEYSRIGDVFSMELQNFVTDLDITPELRSASGTSLTRLTNLIDATAAAQVRALDANSSVVSLVQKALGHQTPDNLEIYSVTSDKAVAVFCQDPTQNLTVVSFRGTKDSKDVLTDITFLASPLAPATSDRINEESAESMEIHRGFGLAFESIENEVSALLSRCPGTRVLFTGHSMGGALAQIAAVRFSHLEPTLVTFASPAIGNRQFCRYLEKVAHPHGGLRVWNEYDIVPSLAQVVGYTHGGVPVKQRLSEQALIKFEKENKKGMLPGFSAVAPHVLFQLGPVEYVFPVLYSDIQPV